MQRYAALLLVLCGLGSCAPRNSSTHVGEYSPDGVEWRVMPSVVGWYALSPTHDVLVTTGPGGGLRLLDFDASQFAALTPLPGDSLWRWRVGSVERHVTFSRGDRSTAPVVALQWTDSLGRVHRYPGSTRQRFVPRDVQFSSSDSVRLTGVVLEPMLSGAARTTRRLPAAIIIQGSGASDRDNVWAYQFAAHLAGAGIVVLLPDKRGSGDSKGRWEDASFDQLADDALAAVRVLRSLNAVDASKVGAVGLSQGGWIAPLLATRGNLAFAVSVSGAAVTPAEQLVHEVTQDLRKAGLDANARDTVLDLLARGQRYATARTAPSWIDYSEQRAKLLRGPLAPIVQRAVADSASTYWTFWQRNGGFDPLPLWRQLRAPALVLYGEQDEHDNVPVALSTELLRNAWNTGGRADNVVRVFQGTGHALADSTTGGVRRDVLEALSAWIRRVVDANTR